MRRCWLFFARFLIAILGGFKEALKRRLMAKIEYAKFLQDKVQEMAKEVQNSWSGEIKTKAENLDEFLNRARTGAGVSNEEILGFALLFNDEVTLDNISKPHLVNMCKYMGISSIATDSYLRYMLRNRLRSIKNDDKLINAEGVESISEAELRDNCIERGMLGILSVEEMCQQLRDWLDLYLNHSLPSSLMILSRAFALSGKLSPEEAVELHYLRYQMRLLILWASHHCHLKTQLQKGGGSWTSLKCRKNLSRRKKRERKKRAGQEERILILYGFSQRRRRLLSKTTDYHYRLN